MKACLGGLIVGRTNSDADCRHPAPGPDSQRSGVGACTVLWTCQCREAATLHDPRMKDDGSLLETLLQESIYLKRLEKPQCRSGGACVAGGNMDAAFILLSWFIRGSFQGVGHTQDHVDTSIPACRPEALASSLFAKVEDSTASFGRPLSWSCSRQWLLRHIDFVADLDWGFIFTSLSPKDCPQRRNDDTDPQMPFNPTFPAFAIST